MAQSKGEEELADTVAFMLMIGLILVVLAYFVLVLLSLVITIWALFAWNKPCVVWGHTMFPDEARTFVYRGLGGAAVLPLVVFLVTLWTGGHVEHDLWVHIVLAGYGLGSVALTYLEDQVRASAPQPIVVPDPPPAAPFDRLPVLPARSRAADQEAAPPFRFASWDDEEEFRA